MPQTTAISKDEMVAMLRRSVDGFNKWREDNPEISINLIGANLRWVHLASANLHFANLTGADITGADLRGVNYTYATMSRAQLALFHKAQDETITLID